LPFSQRVLNLPQIENCPQLKNLIVQQSISYVWWYTKKWEKIQFKTTERELNVFNRHIVEKDKWSIKSKDIVPIDCDNNIVRNEEEDDDDIQWITDS
jgi:hypothetical protein